MSSSILELLATISVALVAVAVGLCLLDGDLGLRTALLVLLLVPEQMSREVVQRAGS